MVTLRDTLASWVGSSFEMARISMLLSWLKGRDMETLMVIFTLCMEKAAMVSSRGVIVNSNPSTDADSRVIWFTVFPKLLTLREISFSRPAGIV